jgi:hypothetical protein
LPAIAVDQSTSSVTETPPSLASQLPQGLHSQRIV